MYYLWSTCSEGILTAEIQSATTLASAETHHKWALTFRRKGHQSISTMKGIVTDVFFVWYHTCMKKDFAHPALAVQKDKPLVYTAMSKHLFYYRMFISVFVLENGGVPLSPFMVFDYFLLDAVDRDLVREGNNNLVKRCDDIWVFGAVSNGVLAEIQIANEQGKTVRYFAIEKPHKIVETTKDEIDMETEVADMRHLL